MPCEITLRSTYSICIIAPILIASIDLVEHVFFVQFLQFIGSKTVLANKFEVNSHINFLFDTYVLELLLSLKFHKLRMRGDIGEGYDAKKHNVQDPALPTATCFLEGNSLSFDSRESRCAVVLDLKSIEEHLHVREHHPYVIIVFLVVGTDLDRWIVRFEFLLVIKL